MKYENRSFIKKIVYRFCWGTFFAVSIFSLSSASQNPVEIINFSDFQKQMQILFNIKKDQLITYSEFYLSSAEYFMQLAELTPTKYKRYRDKAEKYLQQAIFFLLKATGKEISMDNE